MANDNLPTKSPAATPALGAELEALHTRVERMEQLLRGAESILTTIRYDACLSFTPAIDDHVQSHRRAYNMLEFLGAELEEWKKGEADLDAPSDDIWTLMDAAKQGSLRRYGKPVAE